MTRLEKAIEFATKAHSGQTHESGSPYILHPLRVMLSLHKAGESEIAQIVGVLHDTVEDTPTTVTAVRFFFTDEIADAVDALTRRNEETYEAFIDRAADNALARIVKLHDIEDNLALAKIDPLPEPRQSKLRTRYLVAQQVLRLAA